MIKITEICGTPFHHEHFVCENETIYFTVDHHVQKQKDGKVFFIWAGNYEAGFVDGPADVAKFYYPSGLALDNLGNLIVCDTFNNRIRKIDSHGVTSTWIGNSKSEALKHPTDICFDRATETFFFIDSGHHRVCSISSSGLVSTIAGDGMAKVKDGLGLNASFSSPRYIAIDSRRNLFLYDDNQRSLRTITHSGLVKTVFSIEEEKYSLWKLVIDSQDNIFTIDLHNNLTSLPCMITNPRRLFNTGKSCDHACIQKLRPVDWCAEIEAVATFQHFPPDLVSIVASYLPKFFIDTMMVSSKYVMGLSFDSRGLLAGIDGKLYSLDTEAAFDYENDHCPSHEIKDRDCRDLDVDWLMEMSDRDTYILADLCKIKKDKVQMIKMELVLMCATWREMEFINQHYPHEEFNKMRQNRYPVGARIGLYALGEKWPRIKSCMSTKRQIETSPPSSLDPSDWELHAACVSYLEKIKADFLKLPEAKGQKRKLEL